MTANVIESMIENMTENIAGTKNRVFVQKFFTFLDLIKIIQSGHPATSTNEGLYDNNVL